MSEQSEGSLSSSVEDERKSPISTPGIADEYKVISELYKYYTQLSFDIVKAYVTLNVVLIGAVALSSSERLKGATALLITAFALAMTATAMISFRKCIKHCAMLRDRAIDLEPLIGFGVFSRVREINIKTRGGPRAARTLAMIIALIVGAIWLVFLLYSLGLRSLSFPL